MAALAERATFEQVRQSTVDWPLVLNQLRRTGFTFRGLADALQISRMKLKRVQGGTEPSYHEGEKIAAFWCEVMDAERERVPTKIVR